jgi:hypothetical protein
MVGETPRLLPLLLLLQLLELCLKVSKLKEAPRLTAGWAVLVIPVTREHQRERKNVLGGWVAWVAWEATLVEQVVQGVQVVLAV